MAAAKVNERNGCIDGPTNPMFVPTDEYTLFNNLLLGTNNFNLSFRFDLYFRKNPFGGEYTVFAGLEECIKLIANFRIAEDEIAFIQASLPPSCEDGFYNYLRGMDCSNVEIHSISEGYVVFPNVPLMRVEGPIAVVQLLETPLLNLINYASLVATNAARHRFVAGKSKLLLEFGLRRAQGPDGGIGASKYSYMGGFDATSNVAAGKLFGIPLRGTHSHAFVNSFMSPDEITDKLLYSYDGSHACKDFVSLARTWLRKLKRSLVLGGIFGETNQSELAAFTSYALAFPSNFLALVDTYDVSQNFDLFTSVVLFHLLIEDLEVVFQLQWPKMVNAARALWAGPEAAGDLPSLATGDCNGFLQKTSIFLAFKGKAREELPPLKLIRERCIKQLDQMRTDHLRRLNPTPYKVSVSAKLYDFIHFLWLNEAPIGELQ
ncbi:nicotinate phosphoribosyltransferase 1-like [Olea europaea var. sylvestris]|uniref:nicotinate phosphoribosyltransferase 1-like n=1 Tax=Olea europaea var. sylvestris TaxID=158386 RepID=UPI000C1D5A28|nr:nicotinate phosphoribosyltransferase 1-like [Olea europaea var. sylvestris]